MGATIVLPIGATAPAYADGAIVLNSDDVNYGYGVMSRSQRVEGPSKPTMGIH